MKQEAASAHNQTLVGRNMAFAAAGEDTTAGAVVLEITDTSSSTTGDAPSSPPPPPPVSVSDLASIDPLPSPTIAVRADRHRQARAGAMFLAVENLLMECEKWFSTMSSQTSSQLVPLDFIIEVWYFAQEHGVTFVQDICPGYLAQNFVQVISRKSFNKIPYDLLCSTIECPHLTVDSMKENDELTLSSEKQLCEALLCWVSENVKPREQPCQNTIDGQLCLLNKVKIWLLPLEFAAGTKIHWLDFGNNIVCTILSLLKNSLQILLDAVADGTLERYRIRITKYSKKIVLSGCPQITTAFLYLSVLPTDLDAAFKRRIVSSYTQINHKSFILYDELETAVKTLSFRNVHMVDLSKCPKFNDLLYLLLRCPWISEIDLTVDTSTVMPRHSVISSSSEILGKVKPNLRRYYIQYPSYDSQLNSVFSNISRLTLEGRNDIDDVNLLQISVLKKSLCYINIRNCTMLTDDGISTFLLKCKKIHSMVLSYTSFGDQSIQTLCMSRPSDSTDHNDEHAHVMAVNMQELRLAGCKGIGSAALSQLLSNINATKFLCLRETSLTDGALCKFIGSCLEYLDVSETEVSMVSLAPVIRRNSYLNCLKTAGCPSLLFEHNEVEPMSDSNYGDFLQEIKSICYLEDVEMGWGFCPILIEDLIPSFSRVRKMTIGLGTTLAESVLHSLPVICPFLEFLILRFQVISDRIVRNLLESALNLQVLCLHCCLGSLTSYSFQAKAPALRILRLEWVTPWITNDDLTILTQNCSLVELSLSGCKLLDSSSQEIICSGWPNLTLLHLEECGQITIDGVSSIFNCQALEDVLLRHTVISEAWKLQGRGIGKAIISDAIRELPLLRKLALDLCDASEEGYDSPNNLEGTMIRTVRMSRCKSWRSCFEGSSKRVHKDTIVLEWSSRRLTTTIVKERL
ncbi:hypothetical protein EJB05_18972, partial [Eragrostis curvula]